MRRPRAGDEADRARTRAVAAHGLLLGRDDARLEGEAEIAVGVHAQKRRVALAGDEKARALAGRRPHDTARNALSTFETARGPQLIEPRLQQRRQPARRHALPPYRSRARASLSLSRASMSVVIASRSKRRRKAPVGTRCAVVQRAGPAVGDRLAHGVGLVVDGEARNMPPDRRGDVGRRHAHGRDVVGIAVAQAAGLGLHQLDHRAQGHPACTSCRAASRPRGSRYSSDSAPRDVNISTA